MSKTPNFRVEMSAARTLRMEMYDLFGQWEISARSVARELNAAGTLDLIDISLNSKGGDAFEALAIYNLLKQHPAQVIVRIVGAAASAGSLVAMAGDEIVIPSNALMMVHNPMCSVFGGEKDLYAAIERLAKTKDVAAATYAAKTKRPKEDIAKLMDAETWMTGDEAVAAGFADRTEPSVTLPPNPASTANVTHLEYQHAPEHFALLLALAPTPKQETPMTTETTSGTAPATSPSATTPAAALPASVPTVGAGAPVMSAADREAIAAEAQAAERKRAADITSLCSLAGKPELVPDYVAKGTPVMEVQGDLFKTLCKERKPTDDDGSRVAAGGTNDPNEKYRVEFNANANYFRDSGTTLEQYVASRRISDGLDPLRS